MTLYARSKTFKPKLKLNQGTVVLSTLIIFSTLLMGFFYIIQVNGVVSQGYQIRDLKENLKDLQLANQKLLLETAQLQFPANLEELAKKLKMVEADNIVYLKDSAGVAIKPQTTD